MIPLWASGTLIGVLGLLIGSFLNVVIHRVPAGESLVRPGSRCPSCGEALKPWHNVPVLSWLALRGRCAYCHSAISVRYPIVEAGTAALFAAVALHFPHRQWLWPALLWFAAISIALTAIDLDVKRLPDAIVLPSYAVMAGLLAVAATGAANGGSHALIRSLEGAAALGWFYGLIWLIAPAAMGFGDVKFSVIIGGVTAYVSWGTLLVGAFGAFIVGSVIGVALLATGRAGRNTAVPFGPFMAIGAWASLLGAGAWGDWYLAHLG
ncbi:prepilin peptidase [Nocardioides baekrokdamisoli]|uniref:Prepilin peptidase n=1 Tax=Nocardioides baekrokdamisoli TaxID=1804624 RepID=A0A3G9IXU5_9ACTN|nr:A24 family peptidase [Nocardioides baekrokdamisoli]BBH16118.1 prepilin peptidase [Nocardioides baekrokdamisoli]